MDLFLDTSATSFPVPSSTPTVKPFVWNKPPGLSFFQWTFELVLLYVVLRDFFMFVVPAVVKLLSAWVHTTFPATEAAIDSAVDDAVEEVDKFAAAQMAEHKEDLEHVTEELMATAASGGIGLVKRLVSEL